MSSTCVCHTGEWCFYCEMYSPLKDGIERLIENYEQRIKSTDQILETSTSKDQLNRVQVKQAVFRQIICELKAVLEHETGDTRNPPGNK